MVGWLFGEKYVQVSDAVLDKGSSWLRTRHLPAQVEAWDRLALKFFYDRMGHLHPAVGARAWQSLHRL